MVPVPHVRGRMAEATGRPIEVAAPFRLPMESPVDRIPRAAGGPGAAPERIPGDSRAQREAARGPRCHETGGADCTRGRRPEAGDHRESLWRQGAAHPDWERD